MQKLRGQSIIFMVDLRKENEPLRHSVGNRVQILPQNSPMVQFGQTQYPAKVLSTQYPAKTQNSHLH